MPFPCKGVCTLGNYTLGGLSLGGYVSILHVERVMRTQYLDTPIKVCQPHTFSFMLVSFLDRNLALREQLTEQMN